MEAQAHSALVQQLRASAHAAEPSAFPEVFLTRPERLRAVALGALVGFVLVALTALASVLLVSAVFGSIA